MTIQFSTSHNVCSCITQARREGGVGGKLPQAPRRLGGLVVGQKNKVRQNIPFWKEKFKNVLPRGAP